MISKRMEQQLKRTASPIRTAFEKATALAAQYGAEQVCDFSIGNPGAPVPKPVTEAIRELAERGGTTVHGYMSDVGYPEVRAQVAGSLNRRFGTSYSQDHIIMTAGAAAGLSIVLGTLLDPGDEVVIIRPYYPAYLSCIAVWQGVTIVADADPESFQPDLKDLEQKITAKTKAVIINSPNNPTGAVYTKETAVKLGDLLRKKQKQYHQEIFLISDEPYRELVYKEQQLPWWTDYYDNTIVVYSFSKVLSLPGQRIGYVVIPEAVACSKALYDAVRLTAGTIGYVNAPALFQRVAGICIDEQVNLEYYEKNRRRLTGILKHYGFSFIDPEGAFYIFMKVPELTEEAFIELAYRQHIIIVGGTAFGYPGYVRLSFCVPNEVIERSERHFGALAEAI